MHSLTASSTSLSHNSSFRSLLHSLVRTDASFTATLARLALGVSILPHGLQKTFGWFGGYGFTNTVNWFTETMHVPWILAVAAVAAESIGALALLAGFATRLAALGVGAIYVTAVAMIHASNGFFMNWDNTQPGEGIEYFILGLALVAIVVIQGAGAWSVDRLLTRSRHQT